MFHIGEKDDEVKMSGFFDMGWKLAADDRR